MEVPPSTSSFLFRRIIFHRVDNIFLVFNLSIQEFMCCTGEKGTDVANLIDNLVKGERIAINNRQKFL